VATTLPKDLAVWRQRFERGAQRVAISLKVGGMKLQPILGEHRYAVAVREGNDLWTSRAG
jgi:hypothetical protein